jgi:hypothetical protein
MWRYYIIITRWGEVAGSEEHIRQKAACILDDCK